MSKTLSDLNNYLFEELERLNSQQKDDELEIELKRAKGITEVSLQLINNAKVLLEAKKFFNSFGFESVDFFKLETSNKQDPYKEFGNKIEEKKKPSKEEFKDKLLCAIDMADYEE